MACTCKCDRAPLLYLEAKGNHFEAMSLVKKSKKLCKKESDKEGEIGCWLLLARCHEAAKSHEEAQMCCREAQELCDEKTSQQEIEVWQQVVELHMGTQSYEAALQAAAKRLEVARGSKGSVKDQVEAQGRSLRACV